MRLNHVALSRGHSVKLIIDQDNLADLNETSIKGIDAAIEFTMPDSAFGNIVKVSDTENPGCFRHHRVA